MFNIQNSFPSTFIKNIILGGLSSSREQEEAGRRQQELARQFQEVDARDDHDGDGDDDVDDAC